MNALHEVLLLDAKIDGRTKCRENERRKIVTQIELFSLENSLVESV